MVRGKRTWRTCQIPDCPAKGDPQAIVSTQRGGNPERVIAEWLPCGHFVAPPRPPAAPLPAPCQFSAMDQVRGY